MTMSIGIDYKAGTWKTCFTENGQILELCTFVNSEATLAYIECVCAFYAEPIIALSSSLETTLCSLQTLLDEYSATMSGRTDLQKFLVAINALNAKNFHVPALKCLESVPRYRKRRRKDMGNADKVCSVATLLYRMRQQEATWPEMRFLYLEVEEDDRSIVVVKDGYIIDGLTVSIEAATENDEEDEKEREQAFWEGLSEDIAGLMSVHHFEDIVVIDRRSSTQDRLEKNTVVDHLGDTYQCYLFPRGESEPEGFEAAIGASLLAEGLFRPGLASEVVEHLQIK
ncbi:MAG: hypothetical protein NVS4B12_03940 [Ktedonobacteraceae bacterium]